MGLCLRLCSGQILDVDEVGLRDSLVLAVDVEEEPRFRLPIESLINGDGDTMRDPALVVAPKSVLSIEYVERALDPLVGDLLRLAQIDQLSGLLSR